MQFLSAMRSSDPRLEEEGQDSEEKTGALLSDQGQGGQGCPSSPEMLRSCHESCQAERMVQLCGYSNLEEERWAEIVTTQIPRVHRGRQLHVLSEESGRCSENDSP